MKCVPGVFCFMVVLTASAVAQDPKKPIPVDTEFQVEQPVFTFAGHDTGITALTFSVDGRQVGSACAKDVRTWDVELGQERRRFKAASESNQGEFISTADVAISPDGKRVAAAVSSGSRGRPAGLVINEAASAIRVWEIKVWTVEASLVPIGDAAPSLGPTVPSEQPLPETVAQLIVALGTGDFRSRQLASGKLEELGGSVLPTLRKAATASSELEVRRRIEFVVSRIEIVQTEEKLWQDLDAPRRGIKDRVVKILAERPALSEQQVASADYLVTVGRPPTDEELKRVQREFAETNGRPLGVLQLTRGLVQGKEFNTGLAAANGRLFRTQEYLATKPGIGEEFRSISGDDFQKLVGDCAAAVDKAVKTDEPVVDLAYLRIGPSYSELWKDSPEKIMHVLSDEQRDAFAKLTGVPLKSAGT